MDLSKLFIPEYFCINMGVEIFCSSNGIKVLTNEKTFLLDNRTTEKDSVNLISHGHHDHLPAKYNSKDVVCSRHTAKIINIRRNKEVKIRRDKDIRFLDAGHSIGSRMFLINKEILYTGDFNVVPKYCGKARPIKCEHLIIDATFGARKYVFPNYKDVIKEFRDYLYENEKVVICAYSFGKAQEICHLLDKFKIPFSITKPISKVNEALGLKYRYLKNEEQDIIIQHHYGEKEGYKKIALSGWAIEKFYDKALQLDKSFILSDHADFPSLIGFIEKCSPEKVYAFGSHAVELSSEVRKELKISSQPLLKDQKNLSHFF